MEKPSFKEAFWFWLKLGFISFGGPAGQIAIIHEFVVEKKKWISESRFLHALNYTMLLPGPEAQQLATYTGWLLHGTRGGLVAGIFFVLPSMFILLGLSILYARYGNIPWVYAMFDALKPAVLAIVILALIKIGKKSLHTPFHFLLALSAFVGMFFFNIPFPYIIIAALMVAFILRRTTPGLFKHTASASAQLDADESSYFINNQHTTNIDNSKITLVKQLLITSLLWVIPLGLFFIISSDFTFWQQLVFFFTKAAFVTFGGAYAVLPYVAQVSVENLQWLTELQMIDGLALGETTPGPLVMVLVFVGFMAGYNHFGGSLLMGSVGLITTTIYTFIPCFLFIFAGAPFIEKTRENEKIKQALTLVTAAVVGVILNLTLYLGKAVLFSTAVSFSDLNYKTLIWIIVSFIAMYRFKVNMITWILITAAVGFGHYWWMTLS